MLPAPNMTTESVCPDISPLNEPLFPASKKSRLAAARESVFRNHVDLDRVRWGLHRYTVA